MLADDVVAYADGGGKAQAFPKPVHGRDRVGRLLGRLTERGGVAYVRWRQAEINRQPGAIFFDRNGAAVLIVTIDVADELVQGIRAITNPDKLRHLAPEPR